MYSNKPPDNFFFTAISSVADCKISLFKKYIFLIILFSLVSLKGLFATHSMGADMSYECLGNNNYKIRVSFYRDCVGIPASPWISVSISSVSCGISDSIRLFPIPGTGQEITPICLADTSTCNGGPFTGIQEWIYEGTYQFPAQCADWQLVYEQCCRNGAITTINNPLQEEMFIFSSLNNTITPCNNSPVFSNKPVPFICIGQTFCFNHGAFDVDGDSLAYSLIDPLSYGGNPVNYMPPYSSANPLSTNPLMTLNTFTGDFCITPQLPEVTVIAVLVKEYRNGILIGQIERDIQITVISCNNILPYASGINGFSNFTSTICADVPYCFTINSNDWNVGQNVTMTWDQGIPGGTFSASPGPHPTGTFCWTPTQSDAGGTPHCFTVTVTDDACPYYGSQTYAYCITVKNAVVDAGPDLNVNCNGQAVITANGSTAFGNITYQWSNGPTTPSQTVGPGTYSVSVYNGQCTASDVVTVTAISLPVSNFNAPPACVTSAMTFTDMSSISGGTITSWSWDFADGTFSNIQNPVHQYAGAGSYNVCLTTTSNLNCKDTLCKLVTVNPQPTASFNISNVCVGNVVNPVNTSTPLLSSSFNWNFGNGISSNLQSPSVNYNNPGSYPVSLVLTNLNGCSDTFQTSVNVYPSPIINAGTDQNICPGNSATLTATGGQNYNWNPSGGNSSTITVTPVINTQYIVTSSDVNGCTSRDSVIVTVLSLPVVTPADTTICPGGTATLDAGNPGAGFLWSNGATSQTISVGTPGTYSVVVRDSYGCTSSGQAIVSIGNGNLIDNSSTAYSCTGQSVTFDAGNPGNNFLWSNGSTTQTITVSSAGTYSVIVTAPNSCSLSFNSTLAHHPMPVASFNTVPVCDYDSSFFSNLSTVSSGNLTGYQWDFGDGTSSFLATPKHFYGTAGIFMVKLIAVTDSGCTDTSTASINIYPKPSAAFQGTSVCLGQQTSFTENSIVVNDMINSWRWNLGDGSTTFIQHPVHTYNSPGTYPVQLIASTIHGCTDTATNNIQVFSFPVSDAGSDTTICSGATVTIGTNPQSGFSYEWTPTSNINLSNTSSTVFSSLNNSTSTIDLTYYLTTTNQQGCKSIDSITLRILPVPIVNFSAPNPQCLDGNSFTFVPAGNVNNNYSLVWNFGNNSNPQTYSGNFPAPVSFSTPGPHLVSFTYSYSGCPGLPVSDTVMVWEMPETGFLASDYEGCAPLEVTFYPTHPDISYSYNWNIEGQTIHESHPQWTFNTPGNFQVTLQVMNENGCLSDPAFALINVYEVPVASFLNTPEVTQLNVSPIEFQNFSAGADRYEWNFGDGGTADFTNGSHIYNDTGSFNITLIAITVHGCRDTAFGSVLIEEGFSIYIPNAVTPNGDGLNDNFQGYGTYLKSYEMWIYDRWGKVIYFTDSYDKPWDCKIQSVVQNDTYVYRIRVSDAREKYHVFIGHVSVVQ